MPSRVSGVVVAIGVALVAMLTTGCGGDTVDGQPTTAAGQEGLFNPCTDISDDVLRATGVDPATESVDVAGVEQPGWKICGWSADSGWYFLDVFSTRHTLDDAKNNTRLTGFREVTVGSRHGLMHTEMSDTDHDQCFIAFGVEQGLIEVNVKWKHLKPKPEDPCDVVLRHAADLEPHLPK